MSLFFKNLVDGQNQVPKSYTLHKNLLARHFFSQLIDDDEEPGILS